MVGSGQSLGVGFLVTFPFYIAYLCNVCFYPPSGFIEMYLTYTIVLGSGVQNSDWIALLAL